jgi:hypothetical protein
MMTTVFCSQCGNDFTATAAHPWGYSHCAHHSVEPTITAAKRVGGQDAILAAARLLRRHGMVDASDLIISNVAEITGAA